MESALCFALGGTAFEYMLLCEWLLERGRAAGIGEVSSSVAPHSETKERQGAGTERSDCLTGAVVGALGIAGVAMAKDYPTKPVRLLVGQPAGGPTDIVARLLAQKLQERWSQPVVVRIGPAPGRTSPLRTWR